MLENVEMGHLVGEKASKKRKLWIDGEEGGNLIPSQKWLSVTAACSTGMELLWSFGW